MDRRTDGLMDRQTDAGGEFSYENSN
jgi:hypothetical protein